MAKNITHFLHLILVLSVFSCGGTPQQAEEQTEEQALASMNEILNQLTDETTGRVKSSEAKTYIQMIEDFATQHPTSAESPKQLYKGAEVARSIQDYSKALDIYAKIEANFPNYEKASKALFMRAFTYAEDLGNNEKARELYNEFIAKYPNDDFVDDAQILLETMGKTDEEIFEALQAK